jgi:hypothetical protein
MCAIDVRIIVRSFGGGMLVQLLPVQLTGVTKS